MGILRGIGATIAGMLAGGLVVMLVEGISSIVYPPPEGLDMNDREQLAQFVSTLPVGAFLFVLTAWCAGGLAAAWVGRRLDRTRYFLPGLIACGLLFLGAIMNMVMIPHPTWFWFAGLFVIPLGGLAGHRCAAPRAEGLPC